MGVGHRGEEGVDRAHARILRLPIASTVATGAGLDHGGGVELLHHGGSRDPGVRGQRLAGEDRGLVPSAIGVERPRAEAGLRHAGVALGVIQEGAKREGAAPADDRGHEVDEHGADLRQPHLEALEIGGLEQGLHLLPRDVRAREGDADEVGLAAELHLGPCRSTSLLDLGRLLGHTASAPSR
jgi:hypothetical protein